MCTCPPTVQLVNCGGKSHVHSRKAGKTTSDKIRKRINQKNPLTPSVTVQITPLHSLRGPRVGNFFIPGNASAVIYKNLSAAHTIISSFLNVLFVWAGQLITCVINATKSTFVTNQCISIPQLVNDILNLYRLRGIHCHSFHSSRRSFNYSPSCRRPAVQHRSSNSFTLAGHSGNSST